MEIQEQLNVLFWRTGFYGALTEGGVGTLYYSLTNEFVKNGHNVHFASGGPMNLPEKVNKHLIEYNKLLRNFPEVHNLPYNKKSTQQIINLINNYNIDLIYLHHHDFHFGLDLLKKVKKTPIILHLDSIEYWVKKNWGKLYFSKLMKWCEEIELENANSIFVVSDVLKKQLAEFYNINENKIVVSHNGVDVDKFNPQILPDSVKDKFNLRNSFVIGYSGVFNLYHGIDTLIQASKIIINKIKNAKILLIGDGELRKYTDDFAVKNNLENKIIITGLVPFNEVPKYLAACDVLVSPFKSTNNTTFFNSPIKTFEYMAMGKPIVTTNIGQLADICIDKKNSLVMQENNPQSLAEKVFELFKEKELASEIGKEARKFVVDNYSWAKKYELIMEIYNKLK